jgi:uncharacterized protein (TIGR02594 family)
MHRSILVGVTIATMAWASPADAARHPNTPAKQCRVFMHAPTGALRYRCNEKWYRINAKQVRPFRAWHRNDVSRFSSGVGKTHTKARSASKAIHKPVDRRMARQESGAAERVNSIQRAGIGSFEGGVLASVAGRYMGGNPTGWARVWCGAFMRLVVRQAGLPDNPAGNLARSWARYGRPSGPQPGAIAVMPHHVGIVLAADGDRVLIRSGNHGHRVADGWYSASRIIAYRVPS